ncbi:MAG: O-antigen ligase family protein [Longimicrobiales bacterium]
MPNIAASDISAGPAARYRTRFRLIGALRLAVLLLVLGQLGRVPLLSAGAKDAPILFNDLLLLAVLAAAGYLALRRRRLVLDRVALGALAFATIGGISAVLAIRRFDLSTFQFAFSIGYLARWLFYFCVYLVVINFATRRDAERIQNVVLTAALIFGAFGLFQSAFLPNFAQSVYPGSTPYLDWDIQGRRLVSTFLDPNFAGSFLAIALLLGLGRVAYGAPIARWKLLLLFVALLATLSRGALLAFACGGLVLLWGRGLSRRVLRVGASFAVALLALSPVLLVYAIRYNKLSLDDPSLLVRLLAWARALEVWAEYPLLGVGFNTYGFAQQAMFGTDRLTTASFGLDGGLLFIATMTGLVGVTAYSIMLWLVLRRCRRVWRDGARAAQERGLGLGVGAATVAILVHSLFLNSLLYPFLMEVMWVLWGAVAVVAGASRGEAHAEARGTRGVRRGGLVGSPSGVIREEGGRR